MKKIISILSVIAMICCLCSVNVFAGTALAVSAGNAEVNATETVDIPIMLTGAVSFSNLALEVGYDSDVLTLTGVTNGIVGASFTTAQSYSTNPYNLQWDSASNISASGTIATLTFQVAENAKSGAYPITVSYYKGRNGNNTDGDDVNYNADYDALNLQYENGSITVLGMEEPPAKAGNVTVTLGNASANVGEVFTVDLSITKNDGFSNLALEIGYDETGMELISVVNHISGASFTTAQAYTSNPYNLQWDSASNVTFTGTAATLTFKALKKGDYPITVSYYKGRNGNNTDGEDVNYDENDIGLDVTYNSTSVSLKSSSSGSGGSMFVSGISFVVSLDSNVGTVYAGLYDNSGRLNAVKMYPASENVVVSFDRGQTGSYAKIMWWDDNMSPMCEAQTITLN